MKTIYADTWDELTIKKLSYYHAHCRHYYSGNTDSVPEKYKDYIKENHNFVFIYKEDESKQ
jgi:hypothetical protein